MHFWALFEVTLPGNFQHHRYIPKLEDSRLLLSKLSHFENHERGGLSSSRRWEAQNDFLREVGCHTLRGKIIPRLPGMYAEYWFYYCTCTSTRIFRSRRSASTSTRTVLYNYSNCTVRGVQYLHKYSTTCLLRSTTTVVVQYCSTVEEYRKAVLWFEIVRASNDLLWGYYWYGTKYIGKTKRTPVQLLYRTFIFCTVPGWLFCGTKNA